MVNVKTVFGAKGDGKTDDTAALKAAISATIHNLTGGARILYFPTGTYMVKSSLEWKDTDGNWASQLTFQGENQTTTIIKLIDGKAPTGSPMPVVQTSSLSAYTDGGGINGFDNYLFDLTIDTGTNNPAATALDFVGNNYCGLRNVTLRSSAADHTGAVGLNLTKAYPGPCMMRNVSIDGFSYGIKTGHTEYATTFDGLHLTNQKQVGIQNNDNVLSIENLTSSSAFPVIQNLGAASPNSTGLVTLITATLTGQSGASSISAIQNHETLYARDVTATGYRSAIQDASGNPVGSSTAPNEYDSGPVSTQFGGGATSLNLATSEAPEFEETDRSKWANVVTFGADKTGVADSSAAVQAAIDSGATTIFFPTGFYLISRTIKVRDNVRMIEGFDSRITPDTTSAASFTSNNFFVFNNTVDVAVDHVRFGAQGGTFGDLTFLQDDSVHAVSIRDTAFDRDKADTGAAYTNGVVSTGPLYLEDVAGGPWDIAYPQHVYARQFNPENTATKVVNNGGTLWILGLKIEHAAASDNVAGVIDTEAGGKTEVLGGLVYPVTKAVPVHQPAFIVNNSTASFIYAVSVGNPIIADPNTPDGDFKAQVQETQSGVTKSLTSAAVPTRRGTNGLMMPLYTSKP